MPETGLPSPTGSRKSWAFPLFSFLYFYTMHWYLLLLKPFGGLIQSWCFPAQVSGCLPEADQGGRSTRIQQWGRDRSREQQALRQTGCVPASASGPWSAGIVSSPAGGYSCWQRHFHPANHTQSFQPKWVSLQGPVTPLWAGRSSLLTPGVPLLALFLGALPGPPWSQARRPPQSCSDRVNHGRWPHSSEPGAASRALNTPASPRGAHRLGTTPHSGWGQLCFPLPPHMAQSSLFGCPGLGFPLLWLCRDSHFQGLLLAPVALVDS